MLYLFYKRSTVKEKRCVNCFDHCFAHLEKFSPGALRAAAAAAAQPWSVLSSNGGGAHLAPPSGVASR